MGAENQTSPGEHGQRVAGMFGRIARWYDFLNHFLSLGQDIYWRYRLVRHLRLKEKGLVLDLAAGTLDVSMEILRQYKDSRVIGMDFCLPMLEEGKRKKVKGAKTDRVSLAQGDGRKLPLKDASVDAATIAFGIRNIIPRSEAFEELHRVIKPGGRLCILEFGTGKTRIWKGLYNFYLDRLLPLAGKIISGDSGAYRYLADTIRTFPAADELGEEIKQAGFSKVFWQPLLSGIVYIHVAEK